METENVVNQNQEMSINPALEGAQVSELPYQRERQQFRALLLSNPNYFGNLKTSPFPPVLSILSNTSYEELCSVGYQPQFNRLEAVVFIKKSAGYGGGVCSNGTHEFVRFYMSLDNGATWIDQGVSNFTAHDVPVSVTHGRRLEFDVTLHINPRRKFCFQHNQARIRAILSWNVPPPPNTPNYVPVWGNVHDTHIQIDPRRFFVLGEVLKEAKIEPQVLESLKLDQTLEAAEPQALGVAELQSLYVDKGVEPHRFALAEIHSLLSTAGMAEKLQAEGSKGLLQELNLNINLGDIVGKLFPTDGDTRYEELDCIGLNPNLNTLAGVVRVKLPNGYSGGPCSAGSREYVAFWADFNNNGTFETYLGTTSVNVHDYTDVPKEGLEYAVFLPVNLDKYRQPCQQGPRVARIRAILSWNVPPPPANPNFVPVWGNREDTLILIKPGSTVPPGTHPPFIDHVGSMPVPDINPVTGLATGIASVGFTAHDSPFGGEVIIAGHLANPTNISMGITPLKYRVWVHKMGEPWQRLTNTFSITRTQLLNGVWSFLPDVVQSVDGDDFYTYREDLAGGLGDAQIFVGSDILARWQTGGLTGLWQIVIESKDPSVIGPSWFSNTVTTRLDNAAPVPAIAITSGGGNCADFMIGDEISGTYSVTDEHFGSLSLSLLPSLGGSFTQPVPLPRTYPLVPTGGESGTWKLDTTGLPHCGYVVVLGATDRTIVNSGYIGFYNQDVVGLCLREE